MNDFDEAYGEERDLFGEPYPALLEYFDARPPGTLLDLGCGQGRNAIPLAALGYRVTAVDCSAVGVGQAVHRASTRDLTVRGIVADLTAWPIRGRFDVVLADMVLHGIDEPEAGPLLDRIGSAVAPGGVAYTVVPDPGALVERVVAALAPWPTTVREVEHRLEAGEHAGDYTFIAIIGERPAA